tara:strand:- start:26317 stop:26637 length:321 start_codon:yes stop_codon:yes gene_type:complete
VLESAIERPVVKRAERAGYFVRKLEWTGRVGAPDRIFARKDRGVVFIEFKRPGEKPRRSQTEEHKDMRAAGMEVHVCDNVSDALRILWLTPGSNQGPPLDDWSHLV